MQRGLKTQSTRVRKTPEIFIEGIDVIIRLDLGKHKELLTQTRAELISFNEGAAHEIARKKHYRKLIGGGKYDDDALRRSMKDIRVNIQHLTNKAKLSEDKIAHHTLIVDTLTDQLKDYDRRYATINQQFH